MGKANVPIRKVKKRAIITDGADKILRRIQRLIRKTMVHEDIASRKSATIFGQETIPGPSTSHIGKRVALVAQAVAFVYIYARISQIAEMTLSFHATHSKATAQEGIVMMQEGIAMV